MFGANIFQWVRKWRLANQVDTYFETYSAMWAGFIGLVIGCTLGLILAVGPLLLFWICFAPVLYLHIWILIDLEFQVRDFKEMHKHYKVKTRYDGALNSIRLVMERNLIWFLLVCHLTVIAFVEMFYPDVFS